MDKDLIINNTLGATDDYNLLVNNISVLWNNAKEKAITAVNTELLEANWRTGQYIVEFEQGGKARAEYGKQLLVKLSKDLTRLNGKGNHPRRQEPTQTAVSHRLAARFRQADSHSHCPKTQHST